MTYTILIPIVFTLLAYRWVCRNVKSHGMGAAIELLLCGGAAIILSLGVWLAWALAMWGLA